MRLLEVYPSVQGEGPRTGMPITFVRFAGCNMRCPGWPCDTQHAIQPSQYAGKFEKLSPQEVLERIPEYPNAICITGGEPFLQSDMHEFVWAAAQSRDIDIFTNGSFDYEDFLFEYHAIRLIMDWKLQGSGEANTAREKRIINAAKLRRKDSIKFVVKDLEDLTEAHGVWMHLRDLGVIAEFWVGAAWGHIKDADIVEFVLHHGLPWRLNVQQHKYVWDPEEMLR
jgi:7-carboxy-7-deazaguanine synthase